MERSQPGVTRLPFPESLDVDIGVSDATRRTARPFRPRKRRMPPAHQDGHTAAHSLGQGHPSTQSDEVRRRDQTPVPTPTLGRDTVPPWVEEAGQVADARDIRPSPRPTI